MSHPTLDDIRNLESVIREATDLLRLEGVQR